MATTKQLIAGIIEQMARFEKRLSVLEENKVIKFRRCEPKLHVCFNSSPPIDDTALTEAMLCQSLPEQQNARDHQAIPGEEH